MKDGHPFETQELDGLRSRQRRVLRSVPDWLLDNGRTQMPTDDLSALGDAAFLERLVRDRAQTELRELSDIVGSWEEPTGNGRLGRFLNTELSRKGLSQDLLNAHSRLTLQATQSVQPPGAFAREEISGLYRLLFLLQLADLLSTDNYRDPRLAA